MRLRRLLLVTGIAAVALVAFAVAGAGAGLDDGSQARIGADGTAVTQMTNASAQLGESIVRVEQDAETTIRIQLTNSTEATVVVGGSDALNNTITVTDGNGDGVVLLEFWAGSVGTDATHFRPLDDADDYGPVALGPEGAIPVGEYDLTVYVGHGISGEPSDVGTLVVSAPVEPPEASIEGAPVTLNPQDGQTISGTSGLDAGRNVTVRLRSSGDNPFLLTNQVSVGEGGDFSVAFDLSDVNAPANATATVLVDGETLAEAQVDVVEASGSTSSGGQPGFGLGIAVVSLAGLAIGLARRD